jgi:hypothetical protein
MRDRGIRVGGPMRVMRMVHRNHIRDQICGTDEAREIGHCVQTTLSLDQKTSVRDIGQPNRVIRQRVAVTRFV